MIKPLILKARSVKIGDLIVVPIYNEDYARGVHCILRVKAIDDSHEEMIEFDGNMLAHCDGDTEYKSVCVRECRDVAVFRERAET